MQALWIVSSRRQFSHMLTSPPSEGAFLALPIGINLTKSPSTSVGARVVERGREGLDGRPRPVRCAHLWGERDHTATTGRPSRPSPHPPNRPRPYRSSGLLSLFRA